MIQQLILNTLMACQPKVPSSTTSVTNQSLPPESSTSIEVNTSAPKMKPLWPSTLPDPVGLETLPEVKPTSEALLFYASEVTLDALSFYNIEFYDQLSENPYQYVCEKMCELHPTVRQSMLSMYNIQNCKLDLIDNWKAVVGAVQEQGREELLPQLDVQVGVVECNGDVLQITFGRAATTPTKLESFEADWGGYFVRLAQEEATAVFAFTELLEHLQRWKAPAPLQDWCSRIIGEEERHTLMMSGLAFRNGQQSAGIQFPSLNRVSVKDMAIHNALTGCIGETWSAVLLRYQSEHAPKYHGVFRRIAKDETSHAEFSWALHNWLMSQLTEDEQTEVVEAMREMLSKLPEYGCAEEAGEMSVEIFGRAWNAFSEQLEAVLV